MTEKRLFVISLDNIPRLLMQAESEAEARALASATMETAPDLVREPTDAERVQWEEYLSRLQPQSAAVVQIMPIGPMPLREPRPPSNDELKRAVLLIADAVRLLEGAIESAVNDLARGARPRLSSHTAGVNHRLRQAVDLLVRDDDSPRE